MKFERTIAGIRYIAQVEYDDDAYLVQLFELQGAVYSFATGGCQPRLHHLPAFDAIAMSEHDARNLVCSHFAKLAVNHSHNPNLQPKPNH